MKNENKSEEFVRKELGTNLDGSLGVYGGKKYEGLGVHDVIVRISRNLVSLRGSRVSNIIHLFRKNQDNIDYHHLIISNL